MSNAPQKNLFGLTYQELVSLLTRLGEKPYRARQIQDWIYGRKVTDFGLMTNLSKELRDTLAESFEVRPPHTWVQRLSTDGSAKFVFDLGAGDQVEAVFMQMEKGVTLCLSSQVGCAQACSFCLTAQMGFIRNLTAAEIVGQAYTIIREFKVDGPFNVVMMGMGEPLLNLANLQKAIDLFTDAHGFALSPKRITVSTSGHVRNLQRMGDWPALPHIAVSMNATTDAQRNVLMPVNLKWKIAELLDACRRLPIPPREKLTIEYVLIKDINDSPADARRLVKLLANIRCKVNLIPFNDTAALDYHQPPLATIEHFRDILNRSKILNTVRWSKGRDIGAACGQLATPVAHKGPSLALAAAE